MSELLSRAALLRYGALGLPLAFVALPMYVHVPKVYADSVGIGLATLGAVLLGARLLDALVDPWLGWWSDRLDRRRLLTALALPLLAIGVFGLFRPPQSGAGILWLALFLSIAYLGFSIASVNYQAWGAELSGHAHERTRVTASREGFALAGVIVASVLPSLLGDALDEGLRLTAVVFLPLLGLAAALTLTGAAPARAPRAERAGFAASMRAAFGNARFRLLLGIFCANGIAAAIPATLVLFFIADVLRLEEHAGLFLAIYFLAGVAALPVWVAVARLTGKTIAWLASMVLAVGAFWFALLLGPGDLIAFALICAASGATLGADLALPPSMLADVIDRDPRGATAARAGAYFGVWNFVAKMNLALAAGIALPLVGWLGYRPGDGSHAWAVAAVYAGVPVLLKLVAAGLLVRARARFAEADRR